MTCGINPFLKHFAVMVDWMLIFFFFFFSIHLKQTQSSHKMVGPFEWKLIIGPDFALRKT